MAEEDDQERTAKSDSWTSTTSSKSEESSTASTGQSEVVQEQRSLVSFDSNFYLPLIIPLLHIDEDDKNKMFNKVGFDHLRQVFFNSINKETMGQVIMSVPTTCTVCGCGHFICGTPSLIRHIFSPKHMNAYLKKRGSISYKDFSFWQRLFKLFPPGRSMATKKLYEDGLPGMTRPLNLDSREDRFAVMVAPEAEHTNALMVFVSACLARSLRVTIYVNDHGEIPKLNDVLKKKFPKEPIHSSLAGQNEKGYMWLMWVGNTGGADSRHEAAVYLRPPNTTDVPATHALCALQLGSPMVQCSLMLVDSWKEMQNYKEFNQRCASSTTEVRSKLSLVNDLVDYEKKWEKEAAAAAAAASAKAAEAPPPDPAPTVSTDDAPASAPPPTTDPDNVSAPPTDPATVSPSAAPTPPAKTPSDTSAKPRPIAVSKPRRTVPETTEAATASPPTVPPRIPPVPYLTVLPTVPKAVVLKEEPEAAKLAPHTAKTKSPKASVPQIKDTVPETKATVPVTKATVLETKDTVPEVKDIVTESKDTVSKPRPIAVPMPETTTTVSELAAEEKKLSVEPNNNVPPIDTVPADTVPADTVPADTVPIDTVLVDTVSIDTVLVDAVVGIVAKDRPGRIPAPDYSVRCTPISFDRYLRTLHASIGQQAMEQLSRGKEKKTGLAGDLTNLIALYLEHLERFGDAPLDGTTEYDRALKEVIVEGEAEAARHRKQTQTPPTVDTVPADGAQRAPPTVDTVPADTVPVPGRKPGQEPAAGGVSLSLRFPAFADLTADLARMPAASIDRNIRGVHAAVGEEAMMVMAASVGDIEELFTHFIQHHKRFGDAVIDGTSSYDRALEKVLVDAAAAAAAATADENAAGPKQAPPTTVASEEKVESSMAAAAECTVGGEEITVADVEKERTVCEEKITVPEKEEETTVPQEEATVPEQEATVPGQEATVSEKKETMWVVPELTTNPKYLVRYNEDGSEKWSRRRHRLPKEWPDIFIPFSKEQGEAVARMIEEMRKEQGIEAP